MDLDTAASEGYVDDFARLLGQVTDVMQRYRQLVRSLIIAINHDKYNVVDYILQLHVHLPSVLRFAVDANQVKAVDYLIRRIQDLTSEDIQGLFNLVAENGHIEMLDELMNRFAPRTQLQLTEMFRKATINSRVRIARRLLQMNREAILTQMNTYLLDFTEVNAGRNGLGVRYTQSDYPLQEGDSPLGMLQLLIENGADVDVEHGEPLRTLIEGGNASYHIELIKCLIEHGATVFDDIRMVADMKRGVRDFFIKQDEYQSFLQNRQNREEKIQLARNLLSNKKYLLPLQIEMVQDYWNDLIRHGLASPIQESSFGTAWFGRRSMKKKRASKKRTNKKRISKKRASKRK